MLIAVREKISVSFIIIFGTLSFVTGSGAARSGGQLTGTVRGGGQRYISDSSNDSSYKQKFLIFVYYRSALSL